jgi:hypothetical protein
MIDLSSQLSSLESLFKLMREHGIKEVSCDYIHVIMDVPTPKPAVLNEKELLNTHIDPLPNEPWMSISDGQLEAFDKKGII